MKVMFHNLAVLRLELFRSLLVIYKRSEINTNCWLLLQSAIGEGMTRRDHSDVSNQVTCGRHSCLSCIDMFLSCGADPTVLSVISCMQIMPSGRMSKQ